MLFNKRFFLKHQWFLLWFANSWIGRKILCIDGNKSSINKNKIIHIEPNAITWKKGKKFVTEFRTHDKFGKRLYYAFKPLWYLIHFWDILFANNWQPQWNLGFDSLTQYPDAGTGATTCDAEIQQSGSPNEQAWATIIAAAGNYVGASANPINVVLITGDNTANTYRELGRGGFTFDTSSLGAGAIVSASTFSLYGTGKSDALSKTPNINIYSFAPAANNNIAAGDFDAFGSTAYCDTAITYAGWSTSAYNDFAENATGIAAVVVDGITKRGTRNASYDVAASDPNWGGGSVVSSTLGCNSADAAGTTNDPKLVVIYTPVLGKDDYAYLMSHIFLPMVLGSFVLNLF